MRIQRGSWVIVHRGFYKNPRRVRVYTVDPRENRVYVELPSGSGVSTPRSNVRLASDQTPVDQKKCKHFFGWYGQCQKCWMRKAA
jgi:ribosomal protein L24